MRLPVLCVSRSGSPPGPGWTSRTRFLAPRSVRPITWRSSWRGTPTARIDTDAVDHAPTAHDTDGHVLLPFHLDIASPKRYVPDGSLREGAAAAGTASTVGAGNAVAVLHAGTRAWMAAWDPGDVKPHLLPSIRRPDRVAHVHVSGPRADGAVHLPVGAGSTDLDDVFAPLVETRRSGTASVEVFTYDFEYLRASRHHVVSRLDGAPR